MKNLNIEVNYTWEDVNNRVHTATASLIGDWFQYNATQDELSEVMPLTEKLNEVANEFVTENGIEVEEDDEI